MRNIVSFCEARAARLKQSLSALAARREGAIVRGREGSPICARRIFCRDQVVVLIDRYGFQSRLGYDDILDAVAAGHVLAKAPRSVSPPGEIAPATMEERAGAENVIAFRRPVARPIPSRGSGPAE